MRCLQQTITMVNEVTMICMDTSSWMRHHKSDSFLCQIDAIRVYCEKYLQSHPENYVGVMAMGGENMYNAWDVSIYPPCHLTRYVVEPTKDLSLIMSRVHGFEKVGGGTLLVPALTMGSRYLNEKHENLLKRLVVFAGGPLYDDDNEYTELGTEIKERGVAVDVVNFGDQQYEYKKHQLLVLLAAVNNNDNTRMLDLCGHHLDGSSITPLVLGQGEYADCLLEGEDLRTVKNQYDKVHGVTNVAVGYIFRQLNLDEQKNRVAGHRKLSRDDDTWNQKRKRDDRGHDRGATYGRERYYRCHDDERKSSDARCVF